MNAKSFLQWVILFPWKIFGTAKTFLLEQVIKEISNSGEVRLWNNIKFQLNENFIKELNEKAIRYENDYDYNLNKSE